MPQFDPRRMVAPGTIRRRSNRGLGYSRGDGPFSFVSCHKGYPPSHHCDHPPMHASLRVDHPLFLILCLVDAVEARHCGLLRARYVAARKCDTRGCGGGVHNTSPRKNTPRTFSPLCFRRSPPTSLFSSGTTFY